MESERKITRKYVEEYEKDNDLSGLTDLYDYIVEQGPHACDEFFDMVDPVTGADPEFFRYTPWKEAIVAAREWMRSVLAKRRYNYQALINRLEQTLGTRASSWKMANVDRDLTYTELAVTFAVKALDHKYEGKTEEYLKTKMVKHALPLLAEEAKKYVH